MRLRIITTVVALALISGINSGAFSQNTITMPDIMPVSPEASSLIRSMQYPVNYGYGAVDISIPIYDVVVGDVVIPITLSYNHKGLRPHEFTYYLGQGWSLNAEPAIYRKVNGKPDMDCVYTPMPAGLDAGGKNEFMRGITLVTDNRDAFPDEYFYSIPGKGGEFIFRNPAPTSGVETIPYEPIKVDYANGNFTITDDDGVKYYFGKQEITEFLMGVASHRMIPSGWKCQTITTPKGNATFEYTEQRTTSATLSEYIVIQDELVWRQSNPPSDYYYPRVQQYNPNTTGNFIYYKLEQYPGDVPSYDSFEFLPSNEYAVGPTVLKTFEVRNQRISKINFPEGEVVFNMTNANKTLGSIVVRDKSGTTIRQVTLTHNTSEIENGYPVLTAVEVKGGTIVEEKYTFDYYHTETFYSKFPSPGYTQNSAPVNFWGYWTPGSARSGARTHYGVHQDYIKVNFKQRTNQAFRTDYYFNSIGTADRLWKASTNGILKSITTRSGLTTTFTYESDKFVMQKVSGPTGNMMPRTYESGGLRIAKIAHYDATSWTTVERTFKYGDHQNSMESGLGIITAYITPDSYTSSKEIITETSLNQVFKYRQRILSSSVKGELSFAGAPIAYPYVTEYIRSSLPTGTTSGKNHNLGKVVYKYLFSTTSTPYVDPSTLLPTDTKQKQWAQGHLQLKEVYNGNNKVQSSQYTHTSIRGEDIPAGQVHIASTTYEQRYGRYVDKYVYVQHRIMPGGVRLSQQTDTFFYDNGNVTNQVQYEYENERHAYPTKITTTKSDGTNLVTKLKYPLDSQTTGTTEHKNAMTAMVNRNILRPVIERTETLGTGAETTTLTQYTSVGSKTPSGLPVPNILTIKDSRNNNAAEDRITYYQYDSFGNPVYAIKDNLINVVYLWGYNRQHLVAIIENATAANVQTALGESPTTVDISQSNIDSKLNLLRNSSALSSAHITTFKYKPLVGVTEKIDASGMKTTYAYDAAGRLTSVADDKGRKIQDYQYNLKP